MQVTHKLDNATFIVDIHDGYDDEEIVGGGSWEVNRKQLSNVYAQTDFDLVQFDDTDEWIEFADDDDPDERIPISSADALIIFLAAASTAKPAEYHLDYNGSGYWFFHDMIHAEYDSGDGSAVYINEDSEMRALPMGAKFAALAGIPLAEILNELAKARPEFIERFGFDFDAIEKFLESVTVTVSA